jgi:hypothetical protein
MAVIYQFPWDSIGSDAWPSCARCSEPCLHVYRVDVQGWPVVRGTPVETADVHREFFELGQRAMGVAYHENYR